MNTNKRKVARKPRSYDVAFKEAAVRRMLRGDNVVALSGELDVRRALLYRWRDIYRAEGIAGLGRSRGRPRPGREAPRSAPRDPADERIRELEELLGRQAVELDFFERAFRAANLATEGNDAPAASGSIKLSTRSAPKADSASNEPADSPLSAGPDSTVK